MTRTPNSCCPCRRWVSTFFFFFFVINPYLFYVEIKAKIKAKHKWIEPAVKESQQLSCSQLSPPSPSPGFRASKRRNTDSEATHTTWHADLFSTVSGPLLSVTPPDPLSYFPLGEPLPFPASSTSTPLPGALTRKTSLKRRREGRRPPNRCTLCVTPDVPRPGQRDILTGLPVELLLLIFKFAYISPTRLPGCEHVRGYSMTRRATAPTALSTAPEQTSSALGAATGVPSEPPRLPDSVRIHGAKTLLNISLTCRRFHKMLLDPFIDTTFWRSAARFCWSWLPEDLADVQGRETSHQTSWRNLVGVFMRSENGLFRQAGGGRGGVESFGGNKGCITAETWAEERGRKPMAGEKNKRRLLLVCAQPGPDQFHVFPGAEKGEYTLSVSLHGGKEVFVTLDQYGQFRKNPAQLPDRLKKGSTGVELFPPDIFEVKGDRYQLVKVRRGEAPPPPSSASSDEDFLKQPPTPTIEEIVAWNLRCLPEFVADNMASVARCASWKGILVFNLFTHHYREDSAIELLIDPPEDSRIFCIEAHGYPGCEAPPPPGEPMSEKMRGKMRATDAYPPALGGEPGTVYLWQQSFTYKNAADFPATKHLHYVVCNLKVNSIKAVALIRWNVRTAQSLEELVDREFRVVDLRTGDTMWTLGFPNLYWDHRHHDMSVEYNTMRHQKLVRSPSPFPPICAKLYPVRC